MASQLIQTYCIRGDCLRQGEKLNRIKSFPGRHALRNGRKYPSTSSEANVCKAASAGRLIRLRAAILLTMDKRIIRFHHTIMIPGRSAKAVEESIRQLQFLCGDRFHRVLRSITGRKAAPQRRPQSPGSPASPANPSPSLPQRNAFGLSCLVLQFGQIKPFALSGKPH